MDVIEITAKKQEAFSCITVKGEIDTQTCSELRSALIEPVDSGLDLIVDITEVAYIDSSSIGVLVGARKRCGKAGRRMIIVCSGKNRIIHKIFRMVGLDAFFTIVPTVDVAIKQLNELVAEASRN